MEDAEAPAPPVNTRFTLRIDDRPIKLETPTATRFVLPESLRSDVTSYVSLTARQDPGGGDMIRAASVTLHWPLKAGTFDCTPDEDGTVSTGVSLSPGPFFGFSARLTDCRVTVTYVDDDRVVGSFSVNALPPESSSLAGTVSTATGDFDAPIVVSKL